MVFFMQVFQQHLKRNTIIINLLLLVVKVCFMTKRELIELFTIIMLKDAGTQQSRTQGHL